ncbi:MAG: hypothetical protein GX323_00370 [Clostridiales bacterium]|nr:hypothetical protein [Clostridiales bacterium]
MENSLKALILAASISITCMVISVGFYVGRQAKEISLKTTEKLNEATNHLAEEEYLLYDGLLIRGSDLVNFILKNFNSNYIEYPFYIYVDTGEFETIYESCYDTYGLRDFRTSNYIHPLAKFRGRAIRNENGVIIGMSFIAE